MSVFVLCVAHAPSVIIGGVAPELAVVVKLFLDQRLLCSPDHHHQHIDSAGSVYGWRFGGLNTDGFHMLCYKEIVWGGEPGLPRVMVPQTQTAGS